MTDKELLTKFQWLQVTTSRDSGISAFFRRFHKSPEMCIEGQIGNVPCWYLGPIPTIEAKGESNDKDQAV